MSTNRISAPISSTTNEQLDRFIEEFGLEKNFVVEQALLYFMAARRALPEEAFIPTRLVLEDDSFDELVARLKAEPSPTPALRALMRGPEG